MIYDCALLKCLPIFRSFVKAAKHIHHTELGPWCVSISLNKFFENTLCLLYQAWRAKTMFRDLKGGDGTKQFEKHWSTAYVGGSQRKLCQAVQSWHHAFQSSIFMSSPQRAQAFGTHSNWRNSYWRRNCPHVDFKLRGGQQQKQICPTFPTAVRYYTKHWVEFFIRCIVQNLSF